MTREEVQAWVASLKPGNVVIHKQWNNYLSKLTVTKVTPSGIIRTEGDLSFKISNWSESVVERGRGYTEIVPATEDLLQEVERQEQDRAEKNRRDRKIREAVYKMMRANAGNIPYDFASEFLELCDKHGVKL